MIFSNDNDPIKPKRKTPSELMDTYGQYVHNRHDWVSRPDTKFPGSDKNLREYLTDDLENPSLFLASLFEEGIAQYQDKLSLDDGDNYYRSQRESGAFPYNGAGLAGLDVIGDRVDEFIKKGHLDKDFKNRIQLEPFKQSGEGSERNVTTASFNNFDDVILAKKAFLKEETKSLDNYLSKNKIEISPNARDFFSLVAYNGGQGTAQGLLKQFQEEGLLENDKFLRTPPSGEKSKQTWMQNIRRIQGSNMMIGESNLPGRKIEWNRPVEEPISIPKRSIPSDLDFAKPMVIDNINLRPKI